MVAGWVSSMARSAMSSTADFSNRMGKRLLKTKYGLRLASGMAIGIAVARAMQRKRVERVNFIFAVRNFGRLRKRRDSRIGVSWNKSRPATRNRY